MSFCCNNTIFKKRFILGECSLNKHFDKGGYTIPIPYRQGTAELIHLTLLTLKVVVFN